MAGLVLVGVAASSTSGCSDTVKPAATLPPIIKTVTPPFCADGFIRVVASGSPETVDAGASCQAVDGGAGVECCETPCSASACAANANNVCVDNRCELTCKSLTDCAQPGQSCVAAMTDPPEGGTGTSVSICQPNGLAAIGTPCPLGTECSSIKACPDGSSCDYTQCGGATCSPDPLCVVGTKCSTGVCPDGTACTVPGCAEAACQPLLCLTVGVGDANAFCTMNDCQTDANCPGGYACDRVDDPHLICPATTAKYPGLCGATCTSDAACVGLYGTGATCGEANCEGTACKLGSACGSGLCAGVCEAPCVTPSTTNGTTYEPGPFCTTRNQCRPRGVCDPCTTDSDCSQKPGMHCAGTGSTAFCADDCTTDQDCADGFKCTSSECVPRAGSCVGTGGFCETCRADSDCKTGYYCTVDQGGVDRVCAIAVSTCMMDSDCPTAPSGAHGACLDERFELQPGDSDYHTCSLPYYGEPTQGTGPGRFECWAGNTGAPCGAKTDCISNVCNSIDPQTGNGVCK